MRDHFFYLDCETIPSQSRDIMYEIGTRHAVPAPDLAAIKPAANLKNPELIAADIEKRRAKAVEDHEADLAKADAARDADYRKLCFEGATAHLACISFALDDDEVEGFPNYALGKFDGRYIVPSYEEVLEGERQLLRSFFNTLRIRIRDAWEQSAGTALDEMLAADVLGPFTADRLRTPEGREHWIAENRSKFSDLPIIVAHYAGFDVRMVWQRAKILGITPPVWWPVDFNRYRRDEVIDTMTMWCGQDGRISLDDLCKVVGVGGKDDLDGSKVWDAIQQGRLMDVHCYCDEDVERVRRVHKILQRRPEEVDELFEAASAAADAEHGVGEVA